MTQIIQKSLSKMKIVKGFDRAFNNGFCWAIQTDGDEYINVAMIQKYYEEMRSHSAMDGDDDFSDMELNCVNDERMLKFFVPRKLLWRSGDDSYVYALGFMRGVVAGVEQLDLVARLREQYHRGIREYAEIGSDDAAPVGKTATETPRFEGRGSQPPVLQ